MYVFTSRSLLNNFYIAVKRPDAQKGTYSVGFRKPEDLVKEETMFPGASKLSIKELRKCVDDKNCLNREIVDHVVEAYNRLVFQYH
jgi:hypothetical protein